MGLQVLFGGNAGICICVNNRNIWVDAPFDWKQPGFSAMDAEAVLNGGFPRPDALLFTHCHPDHYSREWVLQAMEKYPNAQVCCPEQLPGQNVLTGEDCVRDIAGLKIRFFRLPHEGAQYRDVSHYGILLELPQGNVLLPGDCAVAAPELTAAIRDRKIQLAILDFPWLTLQRGRQFVEALGPKHTLLYHLPFAQDDENQYRKAAYRAAERTVLPDVRLLMDPWQCKKIEF